MSKVIVKTSKVAEAVAREEVYIQAQGTRLHYQVAGPLDAPPLVLLHGIGGCVNWWDKNLPALSGHFRTYALDLPGFGRSWRLRGRYSIGRLAEYVRLWLDLVGLTQVDLLGHSLGGQIAVRLAALYPRRIGRLVLAAPSGLWPGQMERFRGLKQASGVKVPLSQVITIATGTLRTDALALGLSLGAIIGDGEQAARSLGAVQAPTLILWGTADTVLPASLGPKVISLLKNGLGRLEYIENGTHDMMFDQAELFNRQVLNFLLEKAEG